MNPWFPLLVAVVAFAYGYLIGDTRRLALDDQEISDLTDECADLDDECDRLDEECQRLATGLAVTGRALGKAGQLLAETYSLVPLGSLR